MRSTSLLSFGGLDNFNCVLCGEMCLFILRLYPCTRFNTRWKEIYESRRAKSLLALKPFQTKQCYQHPIRHYLLSVHIRLLDHPIARDPLRTSFRTSFCMSRIRARAPTATNLGAPVALQPYALKVRPGQEKFLILLVPCLQGVLWFILAKLNAPVSLIHDTTMYYMFRRQSSSYEVASRPHKRHSQYSWPVTETSFAGTFASWSISVLPVPPSIPSMILASSGRPGIVAETNVSLGGDT